MPKQMQRKTMPLETSAENIHSLGWFLEYMLLCQDNSMEKSRETRTLPLSEPRLIWELFEQAISSLSSLSISEITVSL
jgi:hypothetical protein